PILLNEKVNAIAVAPDGKWIRIEPIGRLSAQPRRLRHPPLLHDLLDRERHDADGPALASEPLPGGIGDTRTPRVITWRWHPQITLVDATTRSVQRIDVSRGNLTEHARAPGRYPQRNRSRTPPFRCPRPIPALVQHDGLIAARRQSIQPDEGSARPAGCGAALAKAVPPHAERRHAGRILAGKIKQDVHVRRESHFW